MAAIDFPDSPTEGDVHTVGDKSWKYTNGVWLLSPYAKPFLINVDGGNPGSTFGPFGAIDGGTP